MKSLVIAIFCLCSFVANAQTVVKVTAPERFAQWWASPQLPGAVYDMRGETFYLDYSQNPDPNGPCKYAGSDALRVQRYPVGNPGDVTLGVGSVDGIFWGGRIIGNISLTAKGDVMASNGGYCNSAAVDMRRSGSTRHQVLKMRIDRVWDGVRFNKDPCFQTPGVCNHVVDTTWISNARDDCIEADLGMSGMTIRDSLLDGCFAGISTTPGGKCSACVSHANDTIRIERSLIRMQGYPYKLQTNYHIGLLKQYPTNLTPKAEVYNSVITAEHYVTSGSEATDAHWQRSWAAIRSCANNVFLWMPDTPMPRGITPPSCFKVMTGSAARVHWQGVRAAWLVEHPDVERIPGDQ
jgi:hypothetical protein